MLQCSHSDLHMHPVGGGMKKMVVLANSFRYERWKEKRRYEGGVEVHSFPLVITMPMISHTAVVILIIFDLIQNDGMRFC